MENDCAFANLEDKFKEKQKVAVTLSLTRIIQSLYYARAGRYINAWMHSLIKSVKPK
jgi:hypothetical protein